MSSFTRGSIAQPFNWYWKKSRHFVILSASVSGSKLIVHDTWLSAQYRCKNAASDSCSNIDTSLCTRTDSGRRIGISTTTVVSSCPIAGTTE